MFVHVITTNCGTIATKSQCGLFLWTQEISNMCCASSSAATETVQQQPAQIQTMGQMATQMQQAKKDDSRRSRVQSAHGSTYEDKTKSTGSHAKR
mmetsp:Transcript_3307/g.4806  ORF Transcript_3307/g.4806 Transcript_3307/m.4806 type:complete len:95 (-) Transcript_3307:337-621(-)